jgi:hypothetical protein
MRLRRALLCGLAIGLVATTGANAASRPKPKTLCNMLSDPSGDGKWKNAPQVVTSPALDVTGGDVATGPKTLVAVMRVTTTDTSSDNFAKTLGYWWKFSAVAGGTRYLFTVRRSIGPTPTETWTATVGDVDVPFTHSTTPTSFIWTVKRSDVKAMSRPRQVWMNFTGTSNAMSSTADDADTRTTRYPDRAPSCVKAA